MRPYQNLAISFYLLATVLFILSPWIGKDYGPIFLIVGFILSTIAFFGKEKEKKKTMSDNEN